VTVTVNVAANASPGASWRTPRPLRSAFVGARWGQRADHPPRPYPRRIELHLAVAVVTIGRMIDFRPCPPDAEPAAALVQAMRDEIAAMYEGLDLDGPDMPKAGPGELSAPGGTFVVGVEDEEPVCCGGLKRLPDGACEVKKMFVAEEARGRGVARALLEELERRARELGYEIARLDTGPRQIRAQRMYQRAGYEVVENFNANPVATFFGEKRL